MALNQRKRQKNAEKRNAKQKARKKSMVVQQRDELTHVLQRASINPVLHCCIPRSLWEQGMGQLLLSRMLPSGDVAYAIFLVDTYCLGVKDVAAGVVPFFSYQERIVDGLLKHFEMVNVTPEALCKIVTGAVAYAKDLGLAPHPDYLKSRALFGDINAAACTEEFVYGKDGKPCYVQGPHDSAFRRSQIMSALTKRLGPDGFYSLMSVSSGNGIDGPWLDEDLDYDEDFDDDFETDSDDDELEAELDR